MRRKSVALFMVIIVMLALSLACEDKGSDPNPNPSSPDVIIPLAVGNYWEFQKIYYDSLGNPTGYDTLRATICNSADLNGRTVYFWSWTEGSWSWLYANLSDGLHVFGNAEYDSLIPYDSLGTNYVSNKYPGVVGDSTFYPEYGFWIITSTSRIKETHAGTFDCYEYTTYEYCGSDEFKTYYSPNRGYIGFEEIDDSVLVQEMKLIDYDISNSPGPVARPMPIKKGPIEPRTPDFDLFGRRRDGMGR